MIAAADAADMMVVPGLRRTGIVFIAEDLRPVFAQLTIHCRLRATELGDAVTKRGEHSVVIA